MSSYDDAHTAAAKAVADWVDKNGVQLVGCTPSMLAGIAVNAAHNRDMPPTANVILFKPGGKYYTEERWRIPINATGPYDMRYSIDFRRIGGGAVLIESQEPWGYPYLILPAKETTDG